MEDSAKLRLQWRDHGNELASLSRDIFCREDLTDVTLACRGGAPFPAHKLILAASSTYFRNFFMEVQGKTNQQQVIFLKDVEPAEMEFLLQFIYLGEVDVPSAELERLIAISKELGIRGLDAVKKEEEEVGERRVVGAAKRKSKPSPLPGKRDLPVNVTSRELNRQSGENPLTPKRAKVEEIPIYGSDDVDDQDPFDEYVDGGEDDTVVAESDVQDRRHEDDSGMDDEAENCFTTSQTTQRDEFAPFQPTKRSGPGKKWSAIWDHFNISETDPKYAVCVYCGRSISRASSQPSKQSLYGMKCHFKSQHKLEALLAEKPTT